MSYRQARWLCDERRPVADTAPGQEFLHEVLSAVDELASPTSTAPIRTGLVPGTQGPGEPFGDGPGI
jgi:hypothetical protein